MEASILQIANCFDKTTKKKNITMQNTWNQLKGEDWKLTL